MLLKFVGRQQQVESIRAALGTSHPGPIMITGEPGMGRTAMVSHAVRDADRENDIVVTLASAGESPLATLRALLPDEESDGRAARELVAAVTEALLAKAAGRRLIVVVDDAHHADHASMLALRGLSRAGRAVLVLTCPTATGSVRTPDPVDCLRYEDGVHTVELDPLTVHEVASVLADIAGGSVHPAITAALHGASGGNPKVLHDFVVGGGFRDRIAAGNRRHRSTELSSTELSPPELSSTGAATGTAAHAGRLVDAAQQSWRELALDRVEELCRLAQAHGVTDRVGPIWATTLLLRGHAEESLRVIGAPSAAASDFGAQQVLAKALGLAFGRRDPESAAEFLTEAGRAVPALQERAGAYRAWLLAVTGRAGEPVAQPERPLDRETRLFRHAANAVVAGAANNATEAIYQLRRARIAAETCLDTVPWMAPVLTSGLIDALLLAGRINEATETASDFHAGKPGCGWDVAVSVSTLINATLCGAATAERLPAS